MSRQHFQTPAEADRLVGQIGLYKPRPTAFRLDVAPFLVAYGLLHGWTTMAAFIHAGVDEATLSVVAPRPPPLALILFPLLLSAHVATFFFGAWSVKARCFIGWLPVSLENFEQATMVRIIPVEDAVGGKDDDANREVVSPACRGGDLQSAPIRECEVENDNIGAVVQKVVEAFRATPGMIYPPAMAGKIFDEVDAQRRFVFNDEDASIMYHGGPHAT